VRRSLAAALALTVTGCGATAPRKNLDRPPAPVTLTAAVHRDGVEVSPNRVGAGALVVVVSNQSDRPQRVTLETRDAVGQDATVGRTASTPEIAPQATGRLKLDARRGAYTLHVADRGVRAATVTVGARRRSAQDDLLDP
jgi:hypothetical protein